VADPYVVHIRIAGAFGQLVTGWVHGINEVVLATDLGQNGGCNRRVVVGKSGLLISGQEASRAGRFKSERCPAGSEPDYGIAGEVKRA